MSLLFFFNSGGTPPPPAPSNEWNRIGIRLGIGLAIFVTCSTPKPAPLVDAVAVVRPAHACKQWCGSADCNQCPSPARLR